jgi:hypothetical protein
MSGKQPCDSGRVFDVCFLKVEAGMSFQKRQTMVLEVDIVIVIEIVDTDNSMPCEE